MIKFETKKHENIFIGRHKSTLYFLDKFIFRKYNKCGSLSFNEVLEITSESNRDDRFGLKLPLE
jgi:hypothetical protein